MSGATPALGGSLFKYFFNTPPTSAPAAQEAAGTPDCPAPRYVPYPDGKTCKERCPATTHYSPATGRCEKG